MLTKCTSFPKRLVFDHLPLEANKHQHKIAQSLDDMHASLLKMSPLHVNATQNGTFMYDSQAETLDVLLASESIKKKVKRFFGGVNSR